MDSFLKKLRVDRVEPLIGRQAPVLFFTALKLIIQLLVHFSISRMTLRNKAALKGGLFLEKTQLTALPSVRWCRFGWVLPRVSDNLRKREWTRILFIRPLCPNGRQPFEIHLCDIPESRHFQC